jgi:hypothetical protein
VLQTVTPHTSSRSNMATKYDVYTIHNEDNCENIYLKIGLIAKLCVTFVEFIVSILEA